MAQYYLGTCYNEGIGTEKDHEKALDYFAQASGSKKALAVPKADQKKPEIAEPEVSAPTTAPDEAKL